MDESDIRPLLRRAVASAEDLPCADIASISVLIEAGEDGLALETLCTQIHEYDIEVGSVFRSELEDLGERLGVHVAYLLGDPWADPPGADSGPTGC